MIYYDYHQFTDKKIEAQRNEVDSTTTTQIPKWQSQDLNSGSSSNCRYHKN